MFNIANLFSGSGEAGIETSPEGMCWTDDSVDVLGGPSWSGSGAVDFGGWLGCVGVGVGSVNVGVEAALENVGVGGSFGNADDGDGLKKD